MSVSVISVAQFDPQCQHPSDTLFSGITVAALLLGFYVNVDEFLSKLRLIMNIIVTTRLTSASDKEKTE